jgi:ADP-heptose:LPS heptosyltransferase
VSAGAAGARPAATERRPRHQRWTFSLRSLERRAKALIIRLLGRLTRASASREPPDWGGRPRRVLYLRYDRIGDMVLATGIIKAIVAAQPTITVDVLASRGNAAVLEGNPFVGTVLTIDRSRPWSYVPALMRIRRARYDAVIDAMVMAPSLTTMILMWASGARHRIGVADRGNDFALTVPVSPVPHAVHYVDHSSAILAAFGVNPEREGERRARVGTAPAETGGVASESPAGWGIWRPEIFLTAAERSQAEARWQAAIREGQREGQPTTRLVVNVSAGADWRYWPDAHFIATVRRVRGAFPDVLPLIIGAPEDVERMQRIGVAAAVPVARTAHYREMMALVATADFAFTADTSVTHIASAFGKPALAMFGRGRAGLYGPYGTSGRTVSTPGTSLDSLEVGTVIEGLTGVLAARR